MSKNIYIAKDELLKNRFSNVKENFRGCMVENEDAPPWYTRQQFRKDSLNSFMSKLSKSVTSHEFTQSWSPEPASF